jgi:hypothetical protein
MEGLKPGERYWNRIDGIESLPQGMAAALADPVTGAFVILNMSQGYPVETAENESFRELQLYLGSPAFIAERGATFSAAYPSALLLKAAPNPIRHFANIEYAIPASTRLGTRRVSLALYDMKGRLVRSFIDGKAAAGRHTLPWNVTDQNGRRLAAGIYRLRLEVDGQHLGRNLQILR